MIRHKSGSLVDCLFSAELVDIDGDVYAVAIFRDISERKHMEEALRASEEKFAKAFRASPDAITIASIDGQRGILDVNEGFVRLTGYSHDEVIGRFTRDLNLWHDLAEQQKMLELIERGGSITNFEFIVRHKSGELISCLMSAELIEIEGGLHAVTIIRDISEHKRMEEALVRERLLG
jgi:PAS domain S-box-containing protein